MADDRIREEVVTQFFLDSCQLRRRVNESDVHAWEICAAMTSPNCVTEQLDFVPLITGSLAEFYIDPMLSCVGDIDIMMYWCNQLAIPSGSTPPTQLPGEFDSHVEVHEIVNSEFPGYVYLMSSCLLAECVDGNYSATECERSIVIYQVSDHGPAIFNEWSARSIVLAPSRSGIRLVEKRRFMDGVYCMRCLTWPPQAADWPTRHRNYGWPDLAVVNHVVSNGCDVVRVAHPLCRRDEWMSKRQWRLSFSRAEIVLLNSWMPEQQIAYHVLRVFVKTERLTDGANNSGAGTLSNYHIKTLMLWACELKSRSWWTDDLNLIRICFELLRTLTVWLSDARCQHYFISNCNLFDRFENSRDAEMTENRLMSVTRASFCKWCINNYMYECAQLCHCSFPWLLTDTNWGRIRDDLPRLVCLKIAVVAWKQDLSLVMTHGPLLLAQMEIMETVSYLSLSLRSCLWSIDYLAKTDQVLSIFFTAVVFLHVALKTMQCSLTDEMLDVLAAACLQKLDARRCLNARHSSALSLSQAAVLMKVAANTSRSTVRLIEIELSKAYLYRALRCKDSDSDSVYCLINLYLAVLYYITGQYQTSIDLCTLLTRSQDHVQCSSRVVQGELLPTIDDHIDNVLGLAVFYQYIRATALNDEQERRHVSVFTTELLAHYLHIKILSITEFRQTSPTSLAEEIQRYRSCVRNSTEIYVTDVMVFSFINRTNYLSNRQLVIGDRNKIKPIVFLQLETSKLVELLQQSAVDHLTRCRELDARDFASSSHFATADFKALYACKCGRYQHCLQLSVNNVRTLMFSKDIRIFGLYVKVIPELMPLMDDDIMSVIGLTTLLIPWHRSVPIYVTIHQLSLLLYLMTQCQIKLRQSVTLLGTTLDYVEFARSNVEHRCRRKNAVDHLVLKFVKQKILGYVSADHKFSH